jgi:hypothetical protein
MGRAARTETRSETTREDTGEPWSGAAGLVRASLIAAVLALAFWASPAHAATGTPEPIAPTATSGFAAPQRPYKCVGAVVRAGGQRLALTARTLMLECKATGASEAAASFRLTRAARKLLGEPPPARSPASYSVGRRPTPV